jgi:hypothetical protein
MLQRLNFSLDEELLQGDWPREQLKEMDRCFVAAMEQAFANGGESPAAAYATVRLGNGSRRLVEASAIQAGWDWLRGNMAEGKDVTAAAVVAFVRERAPGISYARIRLEFDLRFKQRGTEWV